MKNKLNFSFKRISLPRISFKTITPEKRKEILRAVLVISASAVAAAIILGGVSNLLGGITAKNAEKNVYDAMENLIPNATYEKMMPSFDAKASFVTLYEAKKDEEVSGYCVRTSAQGYKNPVDMLVAIDAEGKVIGVEILAIDETIGYGNRIKGDEFLAQFKDKNEELTVVRGKADASNKISAVSGATVSSNAVKEGVNRAIAAVSQLRADAEEKAAAEAKAAEEAKALAEAKAAEEAKALEEAKAIENSAEGESAE